MRYYHLLPILLFCFACEPADDDMAPAGATVGSIAVSVRADGGGAEGATVTTEPPTTTLTTDGDGQAIFSDIAPGSYRIVARKQGAGVGATAVSVAGGAVTNASVELSTQGDGAPMLTVNLGTDRLFEDDSLRVFGTVADDEDAPETLSVVTTDLQGNALGGTSVNPDGTYLLYLRNLPPGRLLLDVSVADSEGLVTTQRRNVTVNARARAVTLDSVVATPNGMKICWTRTHNDDFDRYRVQLSRPNSNGFFSTIQTIYSAGTDTYNYTEIVYGQEGTYRIVMETTTGDAATSNELEAQYIFPSIILPAPITAIKTDPDPDRHVIYVTDENNRLHFIDTDTDELIKSIQVGAAPTDMAISPDGETMYVANHGSTDISVVDLRSREVSRTITVDVDLGDWDGNPYRLAALAEDQLAWVSRYSWQNIHVVSTADGSSRSIVDINIQEPGLVASADGRTLFVNESGTSGSQLYRFNFADGNLSLDQTTEGVINYGTRNVFLTATTPPALFCRNDRYDAVTLAGDDIGIRQEILAVAPDGSHFLTPFVLFTVPGLDEVRSMRSGVASAGAFSVDGAKAYMYHETTQALLPLTVVQ